MLHICLLNLDCCDEVRQNVLTASFAEYSQTDRVLSFGQFTTDRKTQTPDSQTDSHTYSQTDRTSDSQTDSQSIILTDSKSVRQSDSQTDIQSGY